MLHPSYAELIEKVNATSTEAKPVENRYTLALLAAKRARQISEITTLLSNYAVSKGVWGLDRRSNNEEIRHDLTRLYEEVLMEKPEKTSLTIGKNRSLSLAIDELNAGKVHLMPETSTETEA